MHILDLLGLISLEKTYTRIELKKVKFAKQRANTGAINQFAAADDQPKIPRPDSIFATELVLDNLRLVIVKDIKQGFR